ncbi:octanoyl-[acyl-carrier-protein]:protein N-octanoyltransferase LIPT2, mitochondrial-like [Tubulanus polymorphus]|uniref:octanoyl-[acyl-carrier-protein]:protein N-octanoyltransferase LIPT2, mitochondrial-like n=1 Tax=Tubulanus polymorphus TaxID=672921 RepID=UPI003DA6909D
MKGPSVLVYNLGRISYQRGLDIQANFVRRSLDALANKGTTPGVQRPAADDVLLLMQHDPVYTIGIRRRSYTIRDERKLRDLGAEFYPTNRGGLITFHGPGQLVAYPILNLKNYRGLSVRCYIDALQNVLVDTCAEFGVEAQKTADPGAWVQDRKIGAVGVNVRRYISHHGVALNCDVDLNWFEHIVPCGIQGKKATSLTVESSRQISVDSASRVFVDAFRKRFDCDLIHREFRDADIVDQIGS